MLREILRVRIGSYCHGTNNEKSDQDIRSICIPPIQMYFGLNSWDENVRKENGNDFEEWNIKKLFNLLVKGNPSAMNILFVNKKDIFNCDSLGLRLLQNKDIFLSKRIINSCVGYAVSQIQKIEIGRGTKEGNRSAIIEEFGYDVKFMYHAIMMLNMAIELIKHGRYSPLRPEPEQRFLKDIRLGKVTLEEARAVFKSNLETINVIESMCKLQEKPDEKVVEDLLVDILTEHFNEDRSCNTYLQKT